MKKVLIITVLLMTGMLLSSCTGYSNDYARRPSVPASNPSIQGGNAPLR